MESKIEVRDLRAVLEVAEHGSFARAAEALWISRASMSEYVKRVEEALGVRLFDRTTRAVRLTPAGRTFVDHATRVLADLDGMQDAVQAAGALTRGRVRLGLPAGVVNQRIWQAISVFHRDHPAVELEFTETTVDDLVRAIQKGDLDLSVVSWPVGAPPARVAVAELDTEPTTVAVAPDHPLAGRTVAASELQEIPLVTFTEGIVLRTIAEEFCRRADLSPTIALRSSVDETVVGLVRTQVGYTITTQHRAREAGLAVVTTDVAPLDRVRGLAWSRRGPLDPVAGLLRDRISSGFRHELE
ncbi:LysR family transcriptional regulator [Nocardioides sp. GY 10113]|uniref:LysR family transcriptional regulator n=1 Tax=Nocardioides sp. GY 10113 TaxID=2569761 RepID=UPI001458C65C|nr:LysR family transcriptional regulator [Nocardioides sp. GY 10113]